MDMKYLLLTIILLSSSAMMAQQDSTKVDSDTTRIQLGKTTILILSDDCENTIHDVNVCDEPETKRQQTQRLTHWNGFDLGLNGLNIYRENLPPNSVNPYEFLEIDLRKSRSVSINFAEEKLRLIKDYFGVFTGLGIEINSYIFKNDYTLTTSADLNGLRRRTFGVMDSTIRLKKNKLRTIWLNVPIMFEINTSKFTKKNAHIAFGAIGGWRMGTKYKQKFSKDGNNEKVKSNDNFNMEDFKLDGAVRLGYRNVTIFAAYSVTSLFEKGRIRPSQASSTFVNVNPFSLGIQLVGF